jgi:predicted metal-dependent peptidase
MNRLEKQKIRVVLDHPFFGALLMRMNVVENSNIKTLSTDGETLWVNSQYADSLPDEQLRAVLVHEVMHPALGHNWRVSEMDHATANEAADIIVNGMIDEYNAANDNPFPLPDGAVRDPALASKSLEEVYGVLMSRKAQQQDSPNPSPEGGDSGGDRGGGGGNDGDGKDDKDGDSNDDKDGGGDGKDDGKDGDGKDDKDGDGKEGQPKRTKTNDSCPTGDFQPPRKSKPGEQSGNKEQDWANAVVQAAISAQQIGKGSAFAKRFVAEAVKPAETPWQELLRQYLTELANNDYDWQRPDRRFIGSGIYLPSMHSEDAAGDIVFAIDTSGSVDDRLLKEFMVEAAECMETLQPQRLHVIYCDDRIHRVDVFEKGDTVEAHPVGGGGTDFRPVFDHVRGRVPDAKVIVYLTDLDGVFPPSDPGIPTVWVQWGNCKFKPTFGTVVKVKR